MKIGVVTQWYPPEPGFIHAGVAEELAARGHEVRVLTGFPNYPDGRVYPGYRQRWRNVATIGGVTVRRVPLYPSHDASAVRRIGNFVSFAATSTAAAIRFLGDVDALYVYHPPATAFAGPALLRLLRRIPSVLHVQDIWPESIASSGMAPSGAVGRLLEVGIGAVMRAVYRAAAAVVVIAPSMRDLVIARGAEPDKVHVVLNWTDEELFRPLPVNHTTRRELGNRSRCIVMHAGNIGRFQNIGDAVRAAASVAASGELDLVAVGSGLEEAAMRHLARELGADNVRFLGRRPPGEMAQLYAAADFQLVSLLDLPIMRGTIPSKLQAALACASPIIAAAPGDTAELVERFEVGLSSPPQDWRALAKCFLRAARLAPQERTAMSRRAREMYLAQMSRRSGVDRIEAMLIEVAQLRCSHTRTESPSREVLDG